MIESLNLPAVGGGKYILTYVTNELTGEYIPLSFTDRHLRGQQLILGKEVEGDKEMLKYEFINDTLHIYGTMMTGCTPNQYIYCRDDKNGVITFEIVEFMPYDSRALHEVNLYFAGFSAGNYHIGDVGAPTLECKPGDVDAISSLQHNSSELSKGIFSIQGIYLHSPQKGLNIINGKKVMKDAL